MKDLFIILTVIAISAIAGETHAQYFMDDVTAIATKKKCYIITNDGERIEGDFRKVAFNKRYVKSVTLRLADGTKKTFLAEDMKEFVGVPSNLSKLATNLNASTDIERLTDTKFDDVIKDDSVYYIQAVIPKNDKTRMIQLINPGFDSKIKVYKDPRAKETTSMGIGGFKVAGGDDKSYLVQKEGMDQPILIRKKTYREQFVLLFKDCQALIDAYKDRPQSIKISNFAEHVFLYDQLCK